MAGPSTLIYTTRKPQKGDPSESADSADCQQTFAEEPNSYPIWWFVLWQWIFWRTPAAIPGGVHRSTKKPPKFANRGALYMVWLHGTSFHWTWILPPTKRVSGEDFPLKQSNEGVIMFPMRVWLCCWLIFLANPGTSTEIVHVIWGQSDRWFISLFMGFQPSKVAQDVATIHIIYAYNIILIYYTYIYIYILCTVISASWAIIVGWFKCKKTTISNHCRMRFKHVQTPLSIPFMHPKNRDQYLKPEFLAAYSQVSSAEGQEGTSGFFTLETME